MQPASPTGDAIEDDYFGDLFAPKKGRERAIPSPSSVLDDDLTLSPSTSPPPPPPFLGRQRTQAPEGQSEELQPDWNSERESESTTEREQQ
jgi:hypothetical protein